MILPCRTQAKKINFLHHFLVKVVTMKRPRMLLFLVLIRSCITLEGGRGGIGRKLLCVYCNKIRASDA